MILKSFSLQERVSAAGMPTRREISLSQDNVDQLNADFVADASAVYAKWDAHVSSMMGQQLATGVGGVDSAYFPLMKRKLRLGLGISLQVTLKITPE